MVARYAVFGGHIFHLVFYLTISADNGVYYQTNPVFGSFDGGYGSCYLAHIVGQKKAREILFLCQKYSAAEALKMGLVNRVVPFCDLEVETVK